MKFLWICLVLIFSHTGYAQAIIDLNYNESAKVENLVGFNTGFDHRHWVEKESANGITSYTDSIRQDVLTPLLDIDSPSLRFPGGVIANFYHLYPKDFDCMNENPCLEEFTKGYGLRLNEVNTFNNGFGSVGAEYNFEQNQNIELSDNWIVTFADMVLAYEATTGQSIEVIFMANVLSHFKFTNQAAQFSGIDPEVSSTLFQRSITEIEHALKYLIENRNINVTKVELGTELYFSQWVNNNDVSIDRFVNLIPIYRDLLDDLGYEYIQIGVPFHHSHSLQPNADNWSRKLADASYNTNQQYDAWVLHDYQRMVEPCSVVFGNCSNCNDWEDNECELYNGNPNILNCEPDNHSPSSTELEEVYQNKNTRFSQYFNGGLASEYQEMAEDLRILSGKATSNLWMTEWNQIFDAGCDQWKGINKFFPNTFAHGVNIFELLHSFNHQNVAAELPFIEVSSFHTLSAPNILYPIINASNEVLLNSTYYPFEMASIINKKDLQKIGSELLSSHSVEEVNVHGYALMEENSPVETYLYFTNKTGDPIPVTLVSGLDTIGAEIIFRRYVSAEALHSSVNGEYVFKSQNVDVAPIDFSAASEEESISSMNMPAMSFGYFRLNHTTSKTTYDKEANEFTIHPNPAVDLVTLDNIPQDISSIKIVNQYGQLCFTFENRIDKIDISSFSSGMYVVWLQTKNRAFSKKFIKL